MCDVSYWKTWAPRVSFSSWDVVTDTWLTLWTEHRLSLTRVFEKINSMWKLPAVSSFPPEHRADNTFTFSYGQYSKLVTKLRTSRETNVCLTLQVVFSVPSSCLLVRYFSQEVTEGVEGLSSQLKLSGDVRCGDLTPYSFIHLPFMPTRTNPELFQVVSWILLKE